METSERIKLGIVANEFFDPAIGRMGGFGWLARESARILKEDASDLGSPVYLTGEIKSPQGVIEAQSNGVPIIFAQSDWREYLGSLRGHAIELLLTIDYRPDYDYPLSALPGVPTIIWVQDPRPPEDIQKINSLRIPGVESKQPDGIQPIDCHSLAEVVRRADSANRPLLFASPAPQLIEKMAGTYGVTPGRLAFLPYGIEINTGKVSKSPNPRVIFLGRLDPIKRPWLFLEVARSFPEVEFLFMGQAHFRGGGAWNPPDVPQNVHFLGHVDGEEKRLLLSSAWVLLNTSIHEALPVSFLEALQFEIPLISCQNPEGIVSRFGTYTGRWDGTGLESVPHFVEALGQMLDDGATRRRLGQEGRQWVQENHGRENFLAAFRSLREQLQRESAKVSLKTSNQQGSLAEYPEPWGVPSHDYECYLTKRDILHLMPPGQPFILVDQGQLGDFRADRSAIPFLEKDGQYFGPPASDETAIRELERLRAAGACRLVFAKTAFWWLEYYTGFHQYLRSKFRCVLENNRLVIFDLRP